MNATALLAFDDALPERDALLDAERTGQHLARSLGLAPERTRAVRVRAKYRVGESLRVLHRLDAPGVTRLVALRAWPIGAGSYERATGAAVERSLASGGAVDDETLGALVSVYPFDRKLPALGVLDGCDPCASGLSLPAAAGALRWERVGWTPEKSATLRAVDDQGCAIAYAKLYADPAAAAHAASLHASLAGDHLGSSAHLLLPEPLDFDACRRILVLRAAAGSPPRDDDAAQAERDAFRIGAALAVLHQVTPPAQARPFERLSEPAIRRAAELLSRVRPALGDAAAGLAAFLCESAGTTCDDVVSLHGDVHAKNTLLAERAVAWIDLDQAGTGDAACDVGSFVAALRARRIVHVRGAQTARACERGFLAGYASERRLPNAVRLGWHVAAALLVERALRAVHRVRVPELRQLGALLNEATRVAKGALDA